MFDFFKKNKPELLAAENKIPEPDAKPLAKIDHIAIHVMPERFRHQIVKHSSAKTTGLAIMIGGIGFLIIISASLYYFFLRKPSFIITPEPLIAPSNQPDQTEQPAAEINTPEENLSALTATGTEMSTLPTDNQAATSTVATSTAETLPEETAVSFSFGSDSDNDGLTDIEEILLSTGTSTPDSDGDGYVDGAEILNLYDPAGAGKLAANSNIALYENKTFAYEIFYPATWQTSVNGGDDSLMFKSGDNQFVQIIVQPNANKQALDAWYAEQLNVPAINEADRADSANWQGLKSSDGLNLYLMDKKQNYIFSLTYNPGGSNILEYFNIFQMMIKSFRLKEWK